MSYKISNLVAELPREVVNGTQLAVLRAIADRAGDGGICFSSYRDLADRCNFVKSVVRKAIDYLVENKLIMRERQERADSGADTTYNYVIQVLRIAEHVTPLVEKWSESRRKAWYEQTSWIDDWYPHETNQRTVPTRAWQPKEPKEPKGGAVSRHGGVPSPGTGEVPSESTGEVPSPGTHEAVSFEAVSDEAVRLNSPAAAPADAGLPLNDDQDFLDPPLETEVEEVTTYTREDAREVDPWAAIRGSYSEPDLSEPVDDWAQPVVVEVGSGPVRPAAATTEPDVAQVRYIPTVTEGNVNTGFHRFWSVYPRQVDQNAARGAWRAARRRGVDAEVLIAAAEQYAVAVAEVEDSRLIKRPSAWLAGFDPGDVAVAA